MRFPTLQTIPAVRQTVDTFLGYHRGSRIAPGEFADMKNLSSRSYPALRPRKGRGYFLEGAALGGILAKDSLCYIDGRDFVLGSYHVDLGLSPGEKQLISMGAKVVILPDRKWINTLDLTQFGQLDAEFTAVNRCPSPCVPWMAGPTKASPWGTPRPRPRKTGSCGWIPPSGPTY